MGNGVVGALGSLFRTQKVQVGQINYVNGGSGTPLDIPRGLLLKSLRLRLSGTLTVAGGPITSWNSETPLGLMSRIELTADGRKPFWSISGRRLFRKNQFTRGKQGELVSLTNLNNGTYAFVAYVSIDCGAERTINPFESFLDTRLYDGLQLKITFAAGSSLAVVGGGSVTVNAGTLVDVQADYTTTGFEYVAYNKIVTTDTINVTAVSANLKQTLNRNGLLHDLLFATDIDNVVSDSIINNISLRSESSVFHMDHLNWATIQAQNMQDFTLDSPTFGGRISGYAMHELAEDYTLETSLDTTGLNVLDLVFDVANPAGTTKTIDIVQTFYEPAGR